MQDGHDLQSSPNQTRLEWADKALRRLIICIVGRAILLPADVASPPDSLTASASICRGLHHRRGRHGIAAHRLHDSPGRSARQPSGRHHCA
jgi:hypothetical protein